MPQQSERAIGEHLVGWINDHPNAFSADVVAHMTARLVPPDGYKLANRDVKWFFGEINEEFELRLIQAGGNSMILAKKHERLGACARSSVLRKCPFYGAYRRTSNLNAFFFAVTAVPRHLAWRSDPQPRAMPNKIELERPIRMSPERSRLPAFTLRFGRP